MIVIAGGDKCATHIVFLTSNELRETIASLENMLKVEHDDADYPVVYSRYPDSVSAEDMDADYDRVKALVKPLKP